VDLSGFLFGASVGHDRGHDRVHGGSGGAFVEGDAVGLSGQQTAGAKTRRWVAADPGGGLLAWPGSFLEELQIDRLQGACYRSLL
jgi:hypothetical protein